MSSKRFGGDPAPPGPGVLRFTPVGLLRWLTAGPEFAAPPATPRAPVSELPADLPAVIARTFGWLYAGESTPVSRAEILAVPAAAAAVMKIGGTLAGMPLREHLADNTVT